MARIDHFMYAVPALDEGMVWAEQTFGVSPLFGGAHVGLGTCNALLSLGETYLEIIAPDPNQSLQGNAGARMSKLSEGGLVTWAAQGNLAEIAAVLKKSAITCRGPTRTQRDTADGTTLIWDLLFPQAKDFGTAMPFFIDWLDCPHPAATSPAGGALQALTITYPAAEALGQVLDRLDLDVTVNPGPADLSLHITGLKGEVTLHSTPATRAFRFA
jgi:glyoxalase-like protein